MNNPQCRVCGGARTGAYAEKDGYAYARCADCGFVFLEPMPAAEALAALYGGGGVSEASYPKSRSRFRRARIRAWRFGRYLAGRDALDIGCGGGFVVELMRRRGARASGLDIDPQAIAYAARSFPECRFTCEDLVVFAGRGLAFDFIHCSEVFEHVADIAGFMAALARITRPGAGVFVTTPDIGHWRVPGDVTAWDVFSPPAHPRFFTRRAIVFVFERQGFRPRPIYVKLKLAFRCSPNGLRACTHRWESAGDKNDEIDAAARHTP
ncbi:MAG: methyltransferase domain-containing protein, partial [Proteobacteria bacterium]|nr:methyltransferase domain-containing protein [Pseudomonadota bacterium]